jgi:predicted XRE-type DNA-binding protein
VAILAMSQRELSRLVVQRVKRKSLKQREAAALLGVTFQPGIYTCSEIVDFLRQPCHI